jgi:hypothetical protein
MLVWQKELWLIDHGAALYFHHAGIDWQKASESLFIQVKDHVLLSKAGKLNEADDVLRSLLTEDVIKQIVLLIPDDWLTSENDITPAENREVYQNFLNNRIKNSHLFLNEAQHARKVLI